MRRIAVLLTISVFPAFSQAPAPANQLDASESIFTVLAAINAGGYDAEIDSPSNSPFRKVVRDEIAARNLDVVRELKRFVRDHKQANPADELSQYISFALSVDGPPTFTPRYLNNLMPPDAAQLEGLTPLLITFYREAHIAELWKRAQPEFDKVIAEYHAPVSRAVLLVNAYARNPTSGFLGRRFQIYRRPAGRSQPGADPQLCRRLFRGDHAVHRTSHSGHPARLSALPDRSSGAEIRQTVDGKSTAGGLRSGRAAAGRPLQKRLYAAGHGVSSSRRWKAAWTKSRRWPCRRPRKALC